MNDAREAAGHRESGCRPYDDLLGGLGRLVLGVGVTAGAVDLDAGVAVGVGEVAEVARLAAHGTRAVGQLAVLPGLVALRRLLGHVTFLPCERPEGIRTLDLINGGRGRDRRSPPGFVGRFGRQRRRGLTSSSDDPRCDAPRHTRGTEGWT